MAEREQRYRRLPRSRNSARCSVKCEGGGAGEGHTLPPLSALAPCWLWYHFRAGGSALCPGILCCTRHIPPCSVGLCRPPDAAAAHPAFERQLQKWDSISGFPKIVYIRENLSHTHQPSSEEAQQELKDNYLPLRSKTSSWSALSHLGCIFFCCLTSGYAPRDCLF